MALRGLLMRRSPECPDQVGRRSPVLLLVALLSSLGKLEGIFHSTARACGRLSSNERLRSLMTNILEREW